MDFVGVGEGVAVELGLAPVEHVDFPPPERVAQLVFGDVPQVVALDHPVDATGRVLRPPGDARLAMSRVGVSTLPDAVAGEALGGDAGSREVGDDARPYGCGEGRSWAGGVDGRDRLDLWLGGGDRDGRGVGGGVRRGGRPA